MPLFQKLTQIKMFHYPTSNSSNKYIDWQVFDRALHKFWGAVRYVPHVQKEDFLVNSIIYLIASKKISRGWKSTLHTEKYNKIVQNYFPQIQSSNKTNKKVVSFVLSFVICRYCTKSLLQHSWCDLWTPLISWTLYRSNRLFGTFS